MENLLDLRSARYLARELPRLEFRRFADQRSSHGLERPDAQLLCGVVATSVCGRLGFRGMEKLTMQLSTAMRELLGIPGRIPDTTTRDFIVGADWEGVRDGLRRHVKGLYHRGFLDAVGEHTELKMVSLDGKYDRARVRLDKRLSVARNIGLIREAYPYFQPDEEPRLGWLWGEVRILGAVLASSPFTPCLDSTPVLGSTNEMGTFESAFLALHKEWSGTGLFDVVCVDAGMVSLDHADLVKKAGLDYLMAIKKGQQELWGQMEQLLDPRTRPDAEFTERYQGRNVTYRLWRTSTLAGWLKWHHLTQGILVRRTVVADGSTEPLQDEKRFYATSVPWDRLNHEGWLNAIRSHWRVENNFHWTLDMVFKEGKRPWLREPHGMLVMSLLRRIAYNIVALQRARTLCPDDTLAPWSQLTDSFHDALRLARTEDVASRRQRCWARAEGA